MVLAAVAVAACVAAAVLHQRLQAAAKGHAHVDADAHTGVMSAGALGLEAPGVSGPQPQQARV